MFEDLRIVLKARKTYKLAINKNTNTANTITKQTRSYE